MTSDHGPFPQHGPPYLAPALQKVATWRSMINAAREGYNQAVLEALAEGFSPTKIAVAAEVTEAAIRKTAERAEEKKHG